MRLLPILAASLLLSSPLIAAHSQKHQQFTPATHNELSLQRAIQRPIADDTVVDGAQVDNVNDVDENEDISAEVDSAAGSSSGDDEHQLHGLHKRYHRKMKRRRFNGLFNGHELNHKTQRHYNNRMYYPQRFHNNNAYINTVADDGNENELDKQNAIDEQQSVNDVDDEMDVYNGVENDDDNDNDVDVEPIAVEIDIESAIPADSSNSNSDDSTSSLSSIPFHSTDSSESVAEASSAASKAGLGHLIMAPIRHGVHGIEGAAVGAFNGATNFIGSTWNGVMDGRPIFSRRAYRY